MLGQRDLDGEVGRLRDLRLRHARTALIASELVEQRPVRVAGQLSVAALDAVGERGEDVQQPAAHLPPLGAHAGTHECEFRRGGVGAAGGDLPAVGEGLKLFSRIGDAVGDHRVTMVQVSAPLAERVTQIRQRDIGVRGQMPGQPTGRRDQCLLAAGRDRQDGRRQLRRGCSSAADVRRCRRLGEHHVGVGAAESERVDPDDASLAVGERPTRGGNVDLEVREGHESIRSPEVQIGRNVSVLGHQRRLDQSGHAGAGLEVADVGLDRSDQEGIRRRPVQRQRARERPHLDGVAEGRSGAVRLHVPDLGRLDTRSAKSSSDCRFLGFLARHGDAVGVAVLRHRRAEDLRVDLVAVVERLLTAV